tara:strand:- start:491 stop:691 length:201 start_codon:yes stop_codon:yes gene_type:complete
MKKKIIIGLIVTLLAAGGTWIAFNKEEIENKAIEKASEAIIDTAVDKVADKAKDELKDKVLDKLIP